MEDVVSRVIFVASSNGGNFLKSSPCVCQFGVWMTLFFTNQQTKDLKNFLEDSSYKNWLLLKGKTKVDDERIINSLNKALIL